ncbi:hypothetical protein AB8O64_36165 (plasmid) [Streptomyces sp. QH1-20]|uniref:hypothetical protein n=1 Tax=Streptomyces sp. QH1-20 TaxID=3240934 RepID=UPI003513748A
MSIASYLHQILDGKPPTFEITRQGIEQAATSDSDRDAARRLENLLSTHGGLPLSITGATYDTDALTVSGTRTLDGTPRGCSFRFAADGDALEGICLVQEATDWIFHGPNGITTDMTPLRDRGGASKPLVLLALAPTIPPDPAGWTETIVPAAELEVGDTAVCVIVDQADPGYLAATITTDHGASFTDLTEFASTAFIRKMIGPDAADHLVLPDLLKGVFNELSLNGLRLELAKDDAGGWDIARLWCKVAFHAQMHLADGIVFKELTVEFATNWLYKQSATVAEATATLTCFGAEAQVTMSLPDMIITGNIADTTPVLAHVHGELPVEVPPATALKVDVYADLRNKHFLAGITVPVKWTIAQGFELDTILLQVAGSYPGQFGFTVVGLIDIGSATLTLAASKQADATWTLQGTLANAQVKELNGFLHSTFGVTLPAALDGLSVPSMSLRYATKDASLSWTATVDMQLGDTHTTLDSLLTREAGTTYASGILSISSNLADPRPAQDLVLPISFDASYENGGGSTVITGAFKSENGLSLGQAVDELGWRADIGVLDDISLHDAAFTYSVKRNDGGTVTERLMTVDVDTEQAALTAAFIES